MSFDVHFREGVRLMHEGDAAGAQAAFRATLALAPELVAAHINLGLLLTRDQAWDEAEQHYRTALALDPGQLQAYLHLGVLLAARKRFTEAESVYRQALAIDPASPGAWSNLGVLLACVQREAESEECYRAALAIDAGYRQATFNLAYLLLRQGRFDEGWLALDARASANLLANYFQFPRWQGEALAGKRLTIAFEGGHGDMIQFCRYASLAKAQGAAHIVLVCHPALKQLFTRLGGVDQVFGYDEDVPATGGDFWVPPMSLPRFYGIHATLPYLAADADKAARMAPLTRAAGARLRVGLAWQGNPRFENDSDRSLASIDVLAPLFALDGIAFFSLQKGPGQLAAASPLIDLAPHIGDFDDTAALIMGLDLVITVDSAVAHLAGALGKPVWVLLPAYRTDWRWLTERTDTPWYPEVMRLFRQRDAGDWSSVVADIRNALLAVQ